MKIVFAGTPEIALPGLEALRAAGHEIVGVITREDAPVGRKRVMTASAVADFAQKNDIPVLKTNKPRQSVTKWVQDLGADLGVVIAYGGLLKQDLLDAPTHGWINLHFSKLPKWRGAAPVQRALMAGETLIGVSVFRLVEALDAGDVLSIDEWQFEHGTPAYNVLETLSHNGATTLTKAVGIIEADPGAGEAQSEEASYAHKLSRDDAKLDPTQSSTEMLSHWAGVTTEPGAWMLIGDEPIKILSLRALGSGENPEVSSLTATGETVLIGKLVLINTIDGQLVIEKVQPAGKQAMNASDWIRGKNGKVTLS